MASAIRDIQRRLASAKGKFIAAPVAGVGLDITHLSPVAGAGLAFIPKFKPAGQLDYEVHGARLRGPSKDVKKVQRLDAMIGKLTRPFNGASAVPEKTLEKIQKHISDVEDSLSRVGAYVPQEESAGGLFSSLLGGGLSSTFSISFGGGEKEEKKPKEERLLGQLEYRNIYLRRGAKTIQNIARLQLGG